MKKPKGKKPEEVKATYFLAKQSGLFRPGQPFVLAHTLPTAKFAKSKLTSMDDVRFPRGKSSSGGGQGGAAGAAAGGGGGAPGPEATAFLARTSGLDATHTNAYTALINGLVVDGVWSKFDMLHIYATQNTTTALLNLVSTSYNGFYNFTPTFTVDRGYVSVTSTQQCIRTGFIPSTAPSPKFTRDSAHISIWNNTNATDSGNQIGCTNAGYTSVSVIIAKYTDGNVYCGRINGSATAGVAMSDARGHVIANRSASNAVQGYKNGSSVLTNSDPSQALCTFEFITLANNGAGSFQSECALQTAAASIGASLTATDATNFYNRLRTYMTAVGVP